MTLVATDANSNTKGMYMATATAGAPDLANAIRTRVEAPVSTADVPVLTDDYAPTDALLLLFG